MQHPPRLFLQFFRWFCHPRLQKSIEGDLMELYDERLGLLGKRKANRKFILDVLRLFRPAIIRPPSSIYQLNHYGMFKNNFKTALRVMKREKLYSGINILGLTSGLVIALLILFYVNFELSYEKYNPNADRVVRITMDYLDGETLVDQDCETYHSLGPMITEALPEVTAFTRAYGMDGGTVAVVEDQYFRASRVYAVDPTFLQLFGYPLIHGNAETALSEPNQVVLTKSTAIKYFGKTDVVGESIMLTRTGTTMKIVGLVEDSPANSHLKFDLVFSYPSMKTKLDKREGVWDNNDTFTYFLLDRAESYPVFTENLFSFSEKLREDKIIPDERIIAQNIRDIHLYSDKSYEAEPNGEAMIVFFLLGVALLVIIIAIVNYINLSTAKSLDRAKEVGIRKVIGASMGQLRVRFFIESLLINVFAGVATLIILALVFEQYKSFAGLPDSLLIYKDSFSWYLFLSLLAISTVLSGSFPAFILSTFKPVAVLKGKMANSARGIILRKSLVVFQFSLALFLLIQTFTAREQLKFMQEKDLGMNTERVVVVHAPATRQQMDNFIPFQTSLLAYSSFSNVSLSASVPGKATSDMGSSTNINLIGDLGEAKNNFFLYTIDSAFLPTMEMELLAGQNFSASIDFNDPIIVNEEAVRIWGVPNVEDIIGRKTKFWGRERHVVGVVQNFHQTGVKSAHIPMIFSYADKYGDYISIRLSEGNVVQQMEQLEAIYNSHFTNSPFEFFFLDQQFNSQYLADRQFQQVFTLLSFFTLMITCLGLFGLASFTVAKRAKEIGIRKVLGASVSQIIHLLSQSFLRLVLISCLISLPLTYFLVQSWLAQYPFRIGLSIWFFLLPSVLVLLVAFVTVFSRTLQISTSNPTKSLRAE